jgi:UDP-N-acetylglucosamine 2-epimerase (non-hydrolysing)
VDNRHLLERVLKAVEAISCSIPVVFPVHPRTRQKITAFGLSPSTLGNAVVLTDPFGYLEFLNLISSARVVLTDSGGVQEETTVLGVPCVTIRENTERPITCEIGTNQLVGTDPARICGAVFSIIERGGPTGKTPELWDGHAADRIADILLHSGVQEQAAAARQT